MPAESPAELADHPIQLSYVGVKEITFRSPRLPSALNADAIEGPTFAVGRSDYDPEAKTIQVINRIEMSLPGTETFVFRVELVSEFKVDDTVFPAEKVNDWADRAAFYVVFPYLREEVYALSVRVGMKPIILPLLQLPTYRLEKVEQERATAPATAGV